MKIKSILMIFFLLVGSIYLQGQPPHTSSDEVVMQHDDGPEPVKRCTDIVNLKQTCEDDGSVTLSFYIANYSSFTATAIKIEGPNGFVFWIQPDTPSNTVSATEVIYPNADPETEVCFDIKLYNPNVKGGICCYKTICVKVRDCPCATMGKNRLGCLKNDGSFEYCFEVNNPAYSTDIFDEITIFTTNSDLCVNNSTLTGTFPISPSITPGNTGTVCLIIEGCSSPLSPGDIVNLQFFLENTIDQGVCCHDIQDVNIPTPQLCCDISSTATSTASDCNNGGSVTINVTGGTAPYSLTGVGPGVSFLGSSVTRNNLSPGTYNYTVTDANGCVTTGSITVFGILPAPNCDEFDISIQIRTDIDYSFSTFSGVNTTLCLIFDSFGVPDQVVVRVNGAVVQNSGSYSSDGYPGCVVNGGNGPFIRNIPIQVCDFVEIDVTGNTCGLNNTWYDLDVSCGACNRPVPTRPTPTPETQAAESGTSIDTHYKRLNQINGSLKIFPSPVQDVLTIQNTDTEVSYETVNILDSSGKIIQTENMSRNSEIRVDVSSLPRGIYFIDAMDSTGNKVIERFVKVN